MRGRLDFGARLVMFLPSAACLRWACASRGAPSSRRARGEWAGEHRSSPAPPLSPRPPHGMVSAFSFSSSQSLGTHYAIIGMKCRVPSTESESSSMDEKEFFDERQEKKLAPLTCPHCRQPGEYELGWLVRTKKRQLAGRADERDRARFAKARSYMVRRDDMVMCKNMRCRKRFEVSGVQSVAFLE